MYKVWYYYINDLEGKIYSLEITIDELKYYIHLEDSVGEIHIIRIEKI